MQWGFMCEQETDAWFDIDFSLFNMMLFTTGDVFSQIFSPV